MIQKVCWIIFLALTIVRSQSNVNPDISLIGFFNIYTNDVKDTPENGKLNFDTPGFEMLIQGYLNPYSRALATLAYEENEFSAEELYAEILRGLPLDLQIKAGKYLLGFGKLNTFHPHIWPFLNRPLSHQIFLGPEGFNDIGFDVSFILPLEEIYSSLTFGIFRGDAITNTLVSDEKDITGTRGVSPIWVGRWGNFFSLSDYTNLEIGLSGSSGIYARTEINGNGDSTISGSSRRLNYLLAGLDFKYKYVPNIYTALTIQGEGLVNYRDVPRYGDMGVNIPQQGLKTITTYGYFVSVDYRFNKQFSIGAKYDFTYGIVGDEPSFNSLATDDENSTKGLYLWIGFYPVEETLALRMELERLMFDYKDGRGRDPETMLTLQLLFSLGPHKAHPF
jgi:hypothetical protein